MKNSKLATISLSAMSLVMVLSFQNCSKIGFSPGDSSGAFKPAADGAPSGRAPGDDGLMGPGTTAPGDDTSMGGPEDDGDDSAIGMGERVPGDDSANDMGERVPGDDSDSGSPVADGNDPSMPGEPSADTADSDDWLYISGGRGHVPMSSVAICPAGSEDAGSQKCPMFCYKGVDYTVHKSEARNYFAKDFDELPNYGGGAVPGTCANPDLKLKN